MANVGAVCVWEVCGEDGYHKRKYFISLFISHSADHVSLDKAMHRYDPVLA